MPLFADDLNKMNCQCNEPDCDNSALYFFPKCHPRSGMKGIYSKEAKELLLICNKCDKIITAIAIANKTEEIEIHDIPIIDQN